MTCQPITCNGNDLAAVCADIRLRGGCIEAMDVIGTAKYRVSYFERESRPAQADDSPVLSTGALAQLPQPMHKKNVAAGGEMRADKPKSVPDAPASIRPDVGLKSDHQVSESGDESGAVKCSDKHRGVGVSDRGGGLPLESPECGHATLKRDEQMLGEGDPMLQRRNAVPGFSTISIEDRMATLQSKLLASGKIKRSKPKTEARLPYAD